MNIHKNTHFIHISVKPFGWLIQNKESISSLARWFMVSRSNIYRVLNAARIGLLKA